MSEQRESWADFAKRRVPADVDFPDPDARAAVIEVIHEIVERFITPTQGVLTPQPERAQPPGGEHYCPDDWVPGTHNFDLEDADFEYWEAFASTWTPPEAAIVEFLAKHRLQLQRSDQALQFHHVWIGRSASRCASGLLLGLQIGLDRDQETPQRHAEFGELAPLLDRRLGAPLTEMLVMTLFRLSAQLGQRELERPHAPFVRALLEWEAQWFR